MLHKGQMKLQAAAAYTSTWNNAAALNNVDHFDAAVACHRSSSSSSVFLNDLKFIVVKVKN